MILPNFISEFVWRLRIDQCVVLALVEIIFALVYAALNSETVLQSYFSKHFWLKLFSNVTFLNTFGLF